ncbi:MAG: PTS fructose IIA subunit family protein [Xanthomonadaceae bacterium]|jgi:PTS system ascorbate-specific IIA component|nr:PTS fructose IIA subunit family protein [Xanthomonadaceae bacterium]
MSVGILLLSHAGLGSALVGAARGVVGALSLRVEAVEFANGDDPAAYAHRAARAMRELDAGDGVLLLVDLYGSTPSNVAADIGRQGTRTRRVSGLNLPMLLRVLNYPEQALDDLAATAASGGRTGVVVDSA